MRLWITRAQPEADATAGRLTAMGFAAVVEPVLEVQPIGAAPSLDGVAALAFTSRNGVRAFAALTDERAVPVFTVGDATARAAREAGFADVRSASGDVAALAELIAAGKASLAGPVLYLGPEEPAGDLVGELERRGVAARALAVYRTVPAAFADGPPADIDVVMVHSAKAARRLAEEPALRRDAPSMAALCISAAAAEPLHGAGFREVLIAARPSEAAMLDLLEDWARRQAPARLFTPLFWVTIAFGLACILAAILVVTVGPRISAPPSIRAHAATAQPLHFRGNSG